jgi:hypothetical protein
VRLATYGELRERHTRRGKEDLEERDLLENLGVLVYGRLIQNRLKEIGHSGVD